MASSRWARMSYFNKAQQQQQHRRNLFNLNPSNPQKFIHNNNTTQYSTLINPQNNLKLKSHNLFYHCFNKCSYSSSSSSSSKSGLIGWYLRKLEARPVITKAITSSLIYAAADLSSQTITLSSSGSFDTVRTVRMAAFGMFILGPSQHYWFNFVSRVLPKLDVLTTLKKILMGQALFGPTINSVFYSYNAALQGENGAEIVARLKRDLPPTLISGLLYWPVCDFLTYKFVPVHLQPLVNSSFAYVWTIYLTYMASLKRVGSD